MNDWNEKIEETMINLGCKCGAYRVMHDESAVHCNKIDSWISIISISLSTLTATGLFSLEDSQCEFQEIKIISGVSVYFIAFLSSMKQFLKYNEMSEQHKLYSMRFSALYRDIQRQLCLEKKDRQNGKEYLTFINNELDNLLFSNPIIPHKIKKKKLGDYDENSAHETSLSKNIYDIIVKVPDEQVSENPIERDNDSVNSIKNTHYSRYQVSRFLNGGDF